MEHSAKAYKASQAAFKWSAKFFQKKGKPKRAK